MHHYHKLLQPIFLLVVISVWTASTKADCNTYSPAFPLPQLDKTSPAILRAKSRIESALRRAIEKPEYDTTHFSIAVTSSEETLFELHHTARERDEDRPGAEAINGNSCYRIASNTKLFTILALLQQQKAGKLNLDDPIDKYVAELNTPQNGSIPWNEITLRSLASQLSGITRDIAQADDLHDLDDPISHGLPYLTPSQHNEAHCDSMTNYTIPCTRADLINQLKKSTPFFAPKQQSTYSNLNYELLSLALANITSTPYEKLIETTILNPLNLTSTTFTKPPDSVAALPKSISYYWDVVMGIQNPTGGLYSSTTDLSSFIRYTLTHYNALTSSLNWFAPASYATGANTFYGVPWEIFRTTKILSYTDRPVTFVTKGGGLPGYTTYIVNVPDYGFGFTVLTAGPVGSFAALARNVVGVQMVRAADEIAQVALREKYTGTWTAPAALGVNSTITIAHSLERGGLVVARWISNGTDVLRELGVLALTGTSRAYGSRQYLQVVPTLLFEDLERQDGERWRLIGHPVPSSDGEVDEVAEIFADYCLTDIDGGVYGGVSLNEVVFWGRGEEGFEVLELTGFRIRLNRVREGQLSVQV